MDRFRTVAKGKSKATSGDWYNPSYTFYYAQSPLFLPPLSLVTPTGSCFVGLVPLVFNGLFVVELWKQMDWRFERKTLATEVFTDS